MKNKNGRTEIAAVRRENLPGLSLVYALFRTKRSGRDGFAYSVSVSVTGEYGSETATASDLTDSRDPLRSGRRAGGDPLNGRRF